MGRCQAGWSVLWNSVPFCGWIVVTLFWKPSPVSPRRENIAGINLTLTSLRLSCLDVIGGALENLDTLNVWTTPILLRLNTSLNSSNCVTILEIKYPTTPWFMTDHPPCWGTLPQRGAWVKFGFPRSSKYVTSTYIYVLYMIYMLWIVDYQDFPG